jgi:polar amino acid transport system permease protein
MHFDLSLILSGKYHDWLLSGLGMSLTLTSITLLLALPLAIAIALCRLAPFKPLNWLALSYVETIRNIPLLAHLLFWYFGAPELLPDNIKEWLYSTNIEAISAVVGLTFYTAAYMSEDIRSGIRSIPTQQIEDARAIGFGYLAAMRLVILPQALRVTIPPLISQTLNLWQNTSIATVIGVAEIMYQAQKVETDSFRSTEAFAFATVSYLSVSLLITLLATVYHRRYPVRSA